MSCCVLLGLAGCAGRGETDLLHARLREQQQQLADAQTQLEAAQRELKQSRRETEGLRTQLASTQGPGLLPEQSDLLVRVTDLRINPLLTAGLDQDESVGDEVLSVHFAPVDSDGELVRLPGEIEITVLDPQASATDREIARWTFTAAESRERWVRGFLGTGYQFTLPWPSPPRHADLVVHVTLKTADGREFTATHVLKITPPIVTAKATQALRVTPPEASAMPEPAARDIRPPKPVQESTNWTEATIPIYR